MNQRTIAWVPNESLAVVAVVVVPVVDLQYDFSLHVCLEPKLEYQAIFDHSSPMPEANEIFVINKLKI